MKAEVLVVGIGGQGVMTAAELVARAAIRAGMEATKTEVAGMSQRGGSVCSQVRIGVGVAASDIRPGRATLLIGFEAAEALRWAHFLGPDAHAVVNDYRAIPPIVSSGAAEYPDDAVGALRERGIAVFALDAAAIATGLGDARLANTVMLGAAAALLPFPVVTLKREVLERFAGKGALLAQNEAAFEAGRKRADLSRRPASA